MGFLESVGLKMSACHLWKHLLSKRLTDVHLYSSDYDPAYSDQTFPWGLSFCVHSDFLILQMQRAATFKTLQMKQFSVQFSHFFSYFSCSHMSLYNNELTLLKTRLHSIYQCSSISQHPWLRNPNYAVWQDAHVAIAAQTGPDILFVFAFEGAD